MRTSKATLILRVVFALAFSILLIQLKLDYLEAYLYDLRFRLRPFDQPSPKIELILIDQKTVQHFKRIPGYKDYLEVFSRVIERDPKAIAFVTPIAQVGASDDEQAQALAAPTGAREEAQQLAELFKKSGRTYQLTDRMFLKGESNRPSLPEPFSQIPLMSAPKTADISLFAKDGVTRRLLVDYQGEPLGHFQLAQMVRPELQSPLEVKGQFEVYETHQVWIDFQRPGQFRITKFEDLIRQAVDPERFRDQIVLVGDDLGKTLKSYVKTPYSRDPSAMTLVEMHANMVHTLVQNSAPKALPEWLNFLLTGLISIFTVHVVLTLRPVKGIGLLFVMAMSLSLVGFVSFWPFQLMIPMAHPLLAIFLCYYFFIPYRLIIENRRSWEYQQKNKLLSQVEELKTNFISMMSHDLKTPIARIQGMVGVISKDPNPLSSPQREALDHVHSSSEDLLKFIETILNYAKIESQGVELHFENKDVNDLLSEAVRKHEFLAKLKQIELRLELEPQFPIKVDPHLMRQVFSNLIENAIKYSPDGSKVLITSEEVQGMVRVQVSDQGPGIEAQDLPHLFMKFFRSSNAKASPVKGSGLGLYLAKYFVELHKGQIGVESTPGQGSTFTVDLPIESGG